MNQILRHPHRVLPLLSPRRWRAVFFDRRTVTEPAGAAESTGGYSDSLQEARSLECRANKPRLPVACPGSNRNHGFATPVFLENDKGLASGLPSPNAIHALPV